MIRTYAIYDHPTDYPEHWVVRGWEVLKGLREPQPDAEAILCSSLQEARGVIQDLKPGAILINCKDPDPNIAEEWG